MISLSAGCETATSFLATTGPSYRGTIAFFLNSRAMLHDGARFVDSPKFDMLLGMSRRGFRVVLCLPTARRQPVEPFWLIPDEIELFALPSYGGYLDLIFRSPLLLLRSLPALGRASRQWDVLGGTAPGGFGLVMVLLGLVRRRRVFMYARGDIPAIFDHELAGRRRIAQRIITQAFRPLNLVARALAARGVPIFSTGADLQRQFPGGRSFLLGNYGRPEVIGTSAVPPVADRLNRLLYVGRLAREKGVDILLEAVAQLRARDITVSATVVGGGPEESALKAQANELGIESAVQFTGHTGDTTKLRELILGAGIFVMPSRSEGVPMALLEAMALGRTVVAAAVGGIPSGVIDGQNGVLVPAEDPAALAAAIEALTNEPDRATKLAEAARAAGAGLTAQAQADFILERLGLWSPDTDNLETTAAEGGEPS